MIPVERFLDEAARSYLLDNQTSFSFELRFTEAIRASPVEFETLLKKHSFLKIEDYRDLKEGHVRVGRPSRVSFELSDLLFRRPDLYAVKKNWQEALSIAGPEVSLPLFLKKNYSACFKKSKTLVSCVRIFEYLRTHRQQLTGFFPRQVPHAESSKLILSEPLLLRLFQHAYPEKNDLDWGDFLAFFGLRPKPYSFWFYSPLLNLDGSQISRFSGLLHEKNRPRFQPLLSPTLILENEETFLALQEMEPGFNLLRGNGKSIALAGFLKPLFQGPIYYWGDIDHDGYEIFSMVHGIFGNVHPLLMDEGTLKRHENLIQNVAVVIPRPDLRVPEGLHSVYETVSRSGIRIEQEKIPLSELFLILPR